MASRFFAQSWGSRKSHALVKVQAKLLSQRHWKIQWLRWDCLFLFLRTVSTRQVGGAAHPTSFYFVVLIFIPTSASQPMEKASNSFWKLWLGICTQNFHPCPSLWNSVTWPVRAAWEPRKYHPQLGIHLPCSSVYMCCGVILLLQGRRLYWPTEENEQCQCQHKTLFLIVAPLIMCKGQRNLFEPQFYPPENHISQSHYPQQLRREWKWEPKSSRLAPGSVESVLPGAEALDRHTLHLRATGPVWRVGQQLTCSWLWLPFLEPLVPSPESPFSCPHFSNERILQIDELSPGRWRQTPDPCVLKGKD